MSYHDGYDPQQMEGISVVNPLIRIERKFDQIKKLLADEKRIEDMSAADLRGLIHEDISE
jgi:hypothetical protein